MNDNNKSHILGFSPNDGNDWHRIDAYGEKEIESIKDPEGGSEIFLPTAIPTPFARIDLVKTAFKNIIQTKDLRAYDSDKTNTTVAGKNDERLVSHCFDLAELLFNADSFKNDLEIIVWDRDTDLKKLKSGTNGHQQLGETLEVYLQQDAAAYNFNEVEYLFLVRYQYQIIGCTSPVTLFFTTANDLSRNEIRLTTNKYLFSNDYQSLYERDPEFQLYIYSFFQSNLSLNSKMKEVRRYLSKNLDILRTINPNLYHEIQALNSEHYEEHYEELNTGKSGEYISVLGAPVHKRKSKDLRDTAAKSDFVITSEKYIGESPLALQNFLHKPLKYINDQWDNTVQVPYLDETPFQDRKLPGLGVQYPYLTVSDFLEPNLMRLAFPIDDVRYFNGNLKCETGNYECDYALPLTAQFFEFFTTEELLSARKGTPYLEMVQGVAGSVKVRLDIPIKEGKETITFERTYYSHGNSELVDPIINETENKGVVVEHRFSISLFPFIKIDKEGVPEHYRVQLVDQDKYGLLTNTEYRLNFFSDSKIEQEVLNKGEKKRLLKTSEEASTTYYALDKTFDFIQVSNDSERRGILIPKWKRYTPGNKTFKFSVDFGTTNTHIAYNVNDGKKQSFDMSSIDSQVATLFHPKKAPDWMLSTGLNKVVDLLTTEFVPNQIGEGRHKFPVRTVIGEGPRFNSGQINYALADFNIPFSYENTPLSEREITITTNLKWTNLGEGNEERIENFLEELVFLMRNKVLMELGNLKSTEIIWFFPTSMHKARRGKLRKLWKDLVENYFGESTGGLVRDIAESIPPFLYLKKLITAAGASTPVVTIDIGGGTTDVGVFIANKPSCVTSLKFGANTLFGDGYEQSGAADTNQLIKKYLPYFEQLFASNDNVRFLKEVSTEITTRNQSRDVNAFLFSLEHHNLIKDPRKFSYNYLLGNDQDVKVVFLYYYSAIIYHVAELMHEKDLDAPSDILFNGTGSKMLDIITPDPQILAEYTQLIFASVYKTETINRMAVIREKKEPKEITCKGALHKDIKELTEQPIEEIRMVFNGLNRDEKITHKLISEDASIALSVIDKVKNFNKLFEELNQSYSYTNNFGVSGDSLGLFFNQIDEQLNNYFAGGIEFSRKLDGLRKDDETEIEESLFFLPLIGVIRQSMNELAKLNPISS